MGKLDVYQDKSTGTNTIAGTNKIPVYDISTDPDTRDLVDMSVLQTFFGGGSGSSQFRGAWASGTSYVNGDIVEQSGVLYFRSGSDSSSTAQPPSAGWTSMRGPAGQNGAQGDPGPAGVDGNPGTDGRNPYRGAWSASNSYQSGDIVQHDNELYFHNGSGITGDGTQANPETDTANWISMHGADGSSSNSGAQYSATFDNEADITPSGSTTTGTWRNVMTGLNEVVNVGSFSNAADSTNRRIIIPTAGNYSIVGSLVIQVDSASGLDRSWVQTRIRRQRGSTVTTISIEQSFGYSRNQYGVPSQQLVSSSIALVDLQANDNIWVEAKISGQDTTNNVDIVGNRSGIQIAQLGGGVSGSAGGQSGDTNSETLTLNSQSVSSGETSQSISINTASTNTGSIITAVNSSGNDFTIAAGTYLVEIQADLSSVSERAHPQFFFHNISDPTIARYTTSQYLRGDSSVTELMFFGVLDISTEGTFDIRIRQQQIDTSPITTGTAFTVDAGATVTFTPLNGGTSSSDGVQGAEGDANTNNKIVTWTGGYDPTSESLTVEHPTGNTLGYETANGRVKIGEHSYQQGGVVFIDNDDDIDWQDVMLQLSATYHSDSQWGIIIGIGVNNVALTSRRRLDDYNRGLLLTIRESGVFMLRGDGGRNTPGGGIFTNGDAQGAIQLHRGHWTAVAPGASIPTSSEFPDQLLEESILMLGSPIYPLTKTNPVGIGIGVIRNRVNIWINRILVGYWTWDSDATNPLSSTATIGNRIVIHGRAGNTHTVSGESITPDTWVNAVSISRASIRDIAPEVFI